MKELQGQFKTDFENWLISHEINQDVFQIDSLSGYFSGDLHDVFYRLPICAQFGVVQLFASTLNINITSGTFNKREDRVQSAIWCLDSFKLYKDGIKKTLPEAQQEAITQFEKWYNENK